MALRFFRRIRLAPGLTLNLTKRGGSLSIGPRGAKFTVGSSGTRRTVGLPGTGLYYTERGGGRRSRHRAGPAAAPPAPTPEQRLDLGFFKRLITPEGEEHFVDGMRQVVAGNTDQALALLTQAPGLADAAFMAGMLALKREDYAQAIGHLHRARSKHAALGRYFRKYGVAASVRLPITERITAEIEPGTRGIALALAEAHQAREDWENALDELEKLRRQQPDDPVMLLSMAEILVAELGDKKSLERAVRLTASVDNEDEIHAALLYWKGKALHALGLHTAARDALTAAFRRKKNRSDELLRAVQYERAQVYESLNNDSRARQEFERIYAEDPGYEDVAERLGLRR